MLALFFRGGLVLASVFGLVGCDSGGSAESLSGAEIVKRSATALPVEEGRRLFQANCAGCHGLNAQGAADWRQVGSDGLYPPPPLDGNGHAWHHPRAMLAHVIRKGSPGGGKMPAWESKLTDRQVEAIIDWFQSLWPDAVYQAWVEIDRRSKTPQS